MSTEASVPLARGARSVMPESARLASLVEDVSIGVGVFDADMRCLKLNDTFRVMCEIADPTELVGRTLDAALPEASACPHMAALSEVVGGARVASSEHHGTASDRHWLVSWFPLSSAHDDDRGVAVAVAIDVTDRHRAEVALRRSEERHQALLAAANQMVWAATPSGQVTEDCPQWRAITGQDLDEYLGDGWLDAVHPDDVDAVREAWRDAVAEGEVFEHTFRVRTRSGEPRHYRARCVPLVRDGRLAEWVGTHTDVTTQHEADEMRHRLTHQLSEAALRTVRLQKATSGLAEALTVDQVVQTISEIARTEAGVDRVGVALLDSQRIRFRALTPGAVSETAPVADGEAHEPPEVRLDQPGVVANAVRERRTVVVGSRGELLHLLGGGDSIREFLRHTDEQAWVGLPLLSAGSPIGAVRFAFRAPRNVSDEERVFLEALAGQCSLALERAEMFEREHRTAEALQRSLLPQKLPTVPGIGFAAFYRSGTEYVQVGGDWYDAFPLPDGRVAAVLGDVMGKGVKAATGMSRVRNALRALALNGPEPADVLSGLDRMFLATEADEQVTTLAYWVLDPGTGHGHMGNAGHLPALIVGPGGAPRLADTPAGTPLGMPSEREQEILVVPPGNTAVLYSDGLVENRKRGLSAGLDRLVEVASRAPTEVVGDPQELLDYLVGSMLEGYNQDDDVTLLAVHVPVL
ncbi:SpoIIE family protein phosphatase [Spiractinospora alimapuensis]|nr:SpoIIE family protein phosphatase [Spiractinospora alimapuensis]QVQ55149.1 SpoIIE family protein phosphatase [Spiractinospora alimapuensis]